MKPATARRIASFFVPLLTVTILLYQALASLQIAITKSETLVVISVALAAALGAGALAAFGGEWVRTAILAFSAVFLLDSAVHLPSVFEQLRPEYRLPRARDAQRIADLRYLRKALEEYQKNVGPLPKPLEYGEGIGPVSYWQNWWDVSTQDGDGDGRFFLDFLVESGVVSSVPVDPLNLGTGSDDPRSGSQYVYYVVPPDFNYEGGTCAAARGRWIYMLAVTQLESEAERPPKRFGGSGCECLWRNKPNFFQKEFDYVVCDTFVK